MTYLMDKDNFGVDASAYDQKIAYEIVVLRYAIKGNFYARYKSTKIAQDVSDEVVAYVNEHMDSLPGVSVDEDMIRKYNYSEYFSSIIGYTGKISDSEYKKLFAEDDSYTENDVIGKAGLEQYYEQYLRGQNGERKFYIDTVGRISEVISTTDSVAGDDLYLSIDADLQKATYIALEREIAGIVYSNIKAGNIPIIDVYKNLIGNHVIDISHFTESDASTTEQELYASFKSTKKNVRKKIKQELTTSPQALDQMSDELLDEFTHIIQMLKDDGVLLSSEIDTNDETYQKWKNQKISPKEYLNYCVSKQWIDISKLSVDEKYADVFMHNLAFRNKKPFRIMVTATMSAGKSTFINSLVGKYVCLSQNMACTSKIHSIYNKAFEDNYFYEYDHDLVMTAGREELVNDNELNYTDKIIVAGHFNGILSDERILIDDSPGVNFSEDSSHREITEAMLKRKKYDLLIYVMNATQLSTNDENEHLEFVRKTIGKTPLIFVLNKIDSFNEEDENVRDVIDRQIQYLKSKGFKEPIVCPLSARAGYLSKTCQNSTLSRSDKRTLYYLVDKFEIMRLKEYYKTSFPQIKVPYSDDEIEQLQNSCGLSYTEKIIKNYINGGKKL